MPLFDFDNQWSWDEFIHALPGQIPFLGTWWNRAHGEWNPLAQYWNMSEEDLAAAFFVSAAGGKTLAFLELFEGYRIIQFASRLPLGPVAGALAGRYVFERGGAYDVFSEHKDRTDASAAQSARNLWEIFGWFIQTR